MYCEWGFHLNARWRTTNHAQLSGAAAEGDSRLALTLENTFAQLTTINARIARVEDIVGTSAGLTTGRAETLFAVQAAPASLISSSAVVAPAAASTLLHRIWETVPGNKEQNKRADAKAAVNIMKVLYEAPVRYHLNRIVPTKPPMQHGSTLSGP
ncbi:hypothetical protein PHMEG_00020416 [Phytophthora megakarya]|uniref:Uncharacterized protein n=1 Tax=Phytophthora megakarya TaxID=4795 RepID=A0A225VNY9_9STRA|nr:hypothetical protein PHMEG_00020416 [Phytophthora megakarya]